MKRQFPTYSTGVFASSSPINSTKTSFDQLYIFTRKDAPFAQFFSRLCLLARNKRHVRASCHEEKASSNRNLLIEQQNLEQQSSFKLLLPISAGKYPRSNRCQAFRDVTQLILHTCYSPETTQLQLLRFS